MVSVRASLAASHFFFFFLFTLCFLPGSVSGEPDAAALKQALIEKLASTRTWQAQLDQTLTMPDLEPIQGHAQIYYQKPDRLRINFTEPRGQWMLFYQTAAWYQKALASRQAVDLPAKSGPIAMYQFLPRLLNGELNELANGYRERATFAEKGNGGFLSLILDAADPATQPSRIDCRVEPDPLNVKEIRLDFSTHQASLVIEFSNPIRNEPLPPEAFKIPAAAPDPRSK